MARTGFASLLLHTGKAPPWLFGGMAMLSREIVIYMASEFGTREVLRRLSDPFWFQAFGCVLGFFAAGGKGAVSRKPRRR